MGGIARQTRDALPVCLGVEAGVEWAWLVLLTKDLHTAEGAYGTGRLERE